MYSSSNGWSRLRRKWRRYGRPRDFLPFLNALLAAALAINTYSTHPEITTVAGILYLLSLCLFYFITFRDRRAKDDVQGEVLWGLFSLINNEIFKGDHRTRFTLFKRDSDNSDLISPWYRYVKGGRGPIEEAEKSNARYSKGEGVTGEAWAQGGRTVLIQVFPQFENRERFEDFYINELGKSPAGHRSFQPILPQTVRALSAHMPKVRTMLCYAFLDSSERTLGVLSLDFEEPLSLDDGGPPRFSSPYGETIVFDGPRLQLLLNSVQNVMESFDQAERRIR